MKEKVSELAIGAVAFAFSNIAWDRYRRPA